MATLTGQTIASTYDALLKVTDNGPITSSLKLITDGLGNDTALSLSNVAASINGNVTATSFIKSSGTSTQYLMADGSVSTLTNPITGTGTTNTLPKFTGASALGNSNITDSGTLINLGSNVRTGLIGIATNPINGRAIYVNAALTGSVTVYGFYYDGRIESDVTNNALIFSSNPTTPNTVFTLPSLNHFVAAQGTFGASSVVTNQYGFNANSSLIGATNNYGFRGSIPSGTNRWNLYMDGTASNYMAGNLGIGSTSIAGGTVWASKTITGGYLSTSNWGMGYVANGQIQSDVTLRAAGYITNLSTQATAFTLDTLYHFYARVASIGAGSAITNQAGFKAEGSLTTATNNYGFQGSIASGTGRWNLYMDGTADNYINGSFIIGSTVSPTASSGFDPILKVVGGRSGAIFQNFDNSTNSNNLYFTKTRSGIAGNYTVATQLNDGLMFLAGEGSDGVSALRRAATISFFADGNFSATSSPGRIVFGTTPANSVTVSERMRIDSNGSVGIGTISLTANGLRVSKNITGGTTANAVNSDGIIQSDVTSNATGYSAGLGTIAASFTLTNLYQNYVQQGTFGAGSAVTNQSGYHVASNLIGATNNYGFRGQIASGTNRFNLYMDGTANNYMAGALGIGTTSLAGYNLRIAKNITGATTSINLGVEGQIQSDVTAQAIGVRVGLSTAASAFTVTDLFNFRAANATIGAGSSIGVQYGFAVADLTSGGTNYAFESRVTAGTNKFGLYFSGTADNYIAGALGIGSTSIGGYNLRIQKNITGATTSYGITSEGTIQSDVTANVYNYSSHLRTQAAAFSLGTFIHYDATQVSIGAGSSMVNQYGFVARNTMIGATNNYGFYGGIPSATNRWNLYMEGTASNYLAGNLSIGTTTAGRPLTLFATSGQNNYIEISGNGNAVGTQSFAVGQGADNNAYLFNRANSALIIATNGTERARFLAGGNFLINATVDNSTGAKLQVNGGITYVNIFNRRTASYTLVLTDQNDIVEMDVNTGACILTVPLNSAVAFPIGTEIAVLQYGSVQVTIAPTSGVTLRSKANALKISGQFAGCTLVKVGTDEWYVVGDLTN
jgi:hypothetical protein